MDLKDETEEKPVENINDLRSFLEALKKNGQLAEISREVDPVHEIGSVIATLEREHGPAALFTSLKGFPGSIAGGLLSDYQKIGIALGERSAETGTEHESNRQSLHGTTS